jgi:hypothetical protein
VRGDGSLSQEFNNSLELQPILVEGSRGEDRDEELFLLNEVNDLREPRGILVAHQVLNHLQGDRMESLNALDEFVQSAQDRDGGAVETDVECREDRHDRLRELLNFCGSDFVVGVEDSDLGGELHEVLHDLIRLLLRVICRRGGNEEGGKEGVRYISSQQR